jgi:hypothetical protein
MRLSIRVRKTPGRTIVFHHFWCCEFVQSLGFSAFVGASHRSLARAGDRWLVQTNGRTAFVGGAGESDLPTQMPDGPKKSVGCPGGQTLIIVLHHSETFIGRSSIDRSRTRSRVLTQAERRFHGVLCGIAIRADRNSPAA